MSYTCDVGDKIRVTAQFRNSTGVLFDPPAVVCKHKNPSGSITTLTYGVDAQPVKSSTGTYYFDVDITDDGTFSYRVNGTGVGQAAEEGTITANPTAFS